MPSPDDVLDLYWDSLRAIGIEPAEHDVRLVEDDWESPTLGAWGLGWEVWLNGMEVTQFTYFQQVGGFDCRPVPAEITYGLERLAMYIQGVDSVYDIVWVEGPDGETFTYGDVFLENERQYSKHNFELADTEMLYRLFDTYEKECSRLLEGGVVLPAYDYVLKCSPRVQPARRSRCDRCGRACELHRSGPDAGQGVLLRPTWPGVRGDADDDTADEVGRRRGR